MRPSKMSTSIGGISPASSCHQPQDPRFWVRVSHSPICQVGIAHDKGCGTKAEKGNMWSQEAAAWHHATRSWSAEPGAIPQHCRTAAPSPTNLIPHQINDSLTEPRALSSLLLSLSAYRFPFKPCSPFVFKPLPYLAVSTRHFPLPTFYLRSTNPSNFLRHSFCFLAHL